MKKVLSLVLAAMLIFSLVACGETNNTSSTGSTASTGTESKTGTDMKVALVTDVGSLDDESFNQATWEGVETYCKANNVEYTYFQPQEDSTEERLSKISEAVAQNYNVVVMPGYLFGEAIIEAQAEYPDVKFIAVDVSEVDIAEGETLAKNSHCISFNEEQAGYLAGYAAVKDGYTKLGFLGGMAVPAVIRYGYGYVIGADAAATELNKDIDIKYTYGGQFFGDATITAKMEGWYTEGTEVVFACGGGIYTSALEAAVNHKGHVIGVDNDQSGLGKNYVESLGYNPFLTSAFKGLANTVQDTLGSIANGEWDSIGGTFAKVGLAQGDYVGLPTAEGSWNFATFSQADYDAKKAEIKDGKVVVSNNDDPEVKPEVGSHTTVTYIG